MLCLSPKLFEAQHIHSTLFIITFHAWKSDGLAFTMHMVAYGQYFQKKFSNFSAMPQIMCYPISVFLSFEALRDLSFEHKITCIGGMVQEL